MPATYDTLKDVIDDLVRDFLYYDRKENETLAVGEIEEAIEDGTISTQEIIALFGNALVKQLG